MKSKIDGVEVITVGGKPIKFNANEEMYQFVVSLRDAANAHLDELARESDATETGMTDQENPIHERYFDAARKVGPYEFIILANAWISKYWKDRPE